MAISPQERLGRNEAFFREVNERINDVAGSLDAGQETYEYLCECSDPGCAERLELTFAEYEHVRTDPLRFVLAPGHSVSAIEEVVEREPEHEVVEKRGVAAEVAADLNPR